MLTGEFPNGCRYAIKRNPSSHVAYCSITVACGTRAEGLSYPEGTAHFVEHSIFKGTEKLSAEEINATLDSLGGELNAYTTKEEIVLHATTLKEDLPKSLSLLKQLAFEATFPSKEVEVERGVVLDEIISYTDSPSEDIYDNFEKKLFEGSSLGRLILGSCQSVEEIKIEDLRNYYKEFFIPCNMVFSIVSPWSEKQALDLLGEVISDKDLPQKGQRQSGPLKGGLDCVHFEKTEKRKDHEANAVIGGAAPGLYDGRKRIAAVLLANILGGPASNSLLGKELREKNGWVYSVECGYTQYRECGVMAISMGCDRKNLKKCLESTRTILNNFSISEEDLQAAKRQILGQLAISSEGGETQCLSMGKSLQSFGRVSTDAHNRKLILQVSSQDLEGLCREIFSNPSYLIYR